jgi:hypothetical protein
MSRLVVSETTHGSFVRCDISETRKELTKILTGWVAFVNLVMGYCLRDAYSVESTM